MTKPIVRKCIDCKGSMNHSKHHLRCNRCWFINKEKICLEEIDITKRKLKPLRYVI